MLLVAGAVLLLLETILPGMIAGLLGTGCLIASVAVAYARFDFRTGNLVLLIVLAGLTVGMVLYLRYFPNSRAARLFVSQHTVGDVNVENLDLLHQTGTALTQLRPSGMALINGKRVDVVTEGELIERNTPIRVVAVEGMRVVVRKL